MEVLTFVFLTIHLSTNKYRLTIEGEKQRMSELKGNSLLLTCI